MSERSFIDKVLDTLDDVFFAFTLEGEILNWNMCVEEVTGYTPEEIEQMHPAELVPREEAELVRKQMRTVAERGHTRFAAHFETKDGQLIPYEFTGSLLEHEGRKIICGTGRDITEQQRIREDLEASEEKFRMVAEKCLTGIYLVQDEKVKYINSKGADLFGYAPEEMVGRSPEQFIHPEDRDIGWRVLVTPEESEAERAAYTVRGLTKSGEIIYFQPRGTRITYQSRPAVLGNIVDVTKEHRLEQQILQLQEAERRAIGHDLHESIGSQLSGMSMMLQGLVNSLENDEPIQVEEVREITAIVRESMNDVRRLARGLNPVKLENNGLPAALQHLADTTNRRGISRCIFQAEGVFSSLPDKITSNLYWIAQEAVTNAVQHSDADNITINVSSNDSHVKLVVSDDGRGLPENIDASDGLGLQTMRYRADLVGGQFKVTRPQDGGTQVMCRVHV